MHIRSANAHLLAATERAKLRDWSEALLALRCVIVELQRALGVPANQAELALVDELQAVAIASELVILESALESD